MLHMGPSPGCSMLHPGDFPRKNALSRCSMLHPGKGQAERPRDDPGGVYAIKTVMARRLEST